MTIMDTTPQTLHFRYHPRFTAGMVLRHETVITSGVPFKIQEQGWLVRSISFQGKPGFPQRDSYTAVLEPLTEEGEA